MKPTNNLTSWSKRIASLLLVIAFLGFAACSDDDDDNVMPPATENIVQIAQGNSNLSILVQALTKFPDLVSTLSADGSFTVFAPTNDAFAALLEATGQSSLDDIPESVLRRVLEYHVISGAALMSTDLTDGQTAGTVLGDDVTVTIDGDGVAINNSNVVTADVEATNGVVHVVDAVLVPELEASILNTIVEPAYFNKDFSILTAAVVKADLLNTLIDGDANYTLFAPNNDAFEAAGITSLDGLSAEDLTPILLYHVIDGEVFASDLPATGTMENPFAATVSTLNGDFYLTNNSNGVFINGKSAITTATNSGDALDYDNGVVHTIDQTLMPEDNNDIIAVAQAAGFTELAAALTEANLVSALQNPNGPFTVFAPTNDAFDALYTTLGVNDATEIDDATLEAVLKYHVISGARVFSTDLSDGLAATSLQGADFTVNVGSSVTLTDNDPDNADANVTMIDVLATNGVVHVIDAVILPIDI